MRPGAVRMSTRDKTTSTSHRFYPTLLFLLEEPTIMRKRMTPLALCCVALFLATASARAEALKAGDTAPAFELPGSDGKTYKLADFKGKQAVVIAWFPKAFTGG